jgi:hypothetical protein
MPNRAGVVPFRWDVRRREQLGRLLDAPEAPLPYWYPNRPAWDETLAEIRTCCARVVGRAGDARLVFIGRSPENLFDYLTGALADTAWADRCDLLNVSMPGVVQAGGEIPRVAVDAFRAQLRALELTPAQIASAPRPVALVDLVSRGGTFGSLADSLAVWAREVRVDVNAVRRRLRFVGLTPRTKNSPNTWRWFQRVSWAGDFPRGALRGVSIPGWFWGHLGVYGEKMMPSNDCTRWGTEDLMRPVHDPETIGALRMALRIHEHARTRDERARFAAELVARDEMREPWLRSLVVGIRRSAGVR